MRGIADARAVTHPYNHEHMAGPRKTLSNFWSWDCRSVIVISWISYTLSWLNTR